MFQLCSFYITEGEPGTLDRGCRAARDRVGTMRPRITRTMRFATSLIDLLKKDFVFYKNQISTDIIAFLHAFTIAFLVLTIVEEAWWGQRWRRLGRGLLVVLCLGYLGMCLYRVASYTLSPTLFDHVEASTVCISWLWAAWGALNHPADAAVAVCQPLRTDDVHRRRAVPDAFGPSIFAAKLAGAVQCIGGGMRAVRHPETEKPAPDGTGRDDVFHAGADAGGWVGLLLLCEVRAPPDLLDLRRAVREWVALPSWAMIGCGVAAGIDVNLKLNAAL